MSRHSRNKVSYSVDEALNYFLESDQEVLGQLEDDITVIAALIPNVMMMMTLFQLQLMFPSLKLTRILIK